MDFWIILPIIYVSRLIDRFTTREYIIKRPVDSFRSKAVEIKKQNISNGIKCGINQKTHDGDERD